VILSRNYPFFYNKKAINFIKEFPFFDDGIFKSRSHYLNGIKNVALKNIEDELKVEFDTFEGVSGNGDTLLGETFKNVTLEIADNKIVLEHIFVDSFSSAYVSSLRDKAFNKEKKKYFKLVIPIKEKVNFHFQLSNFTFSSENWKFSASGTSLEIDKEDIFILLETDDKKQDYIIIESKTKQLFNDFCRKAFAIRVGLGYILGFFPGNKGYFFAYGNKKMMDFVNFAFMSLRGEIKTSLQPINSNPHAWMRNRKEADKYYRGKVLRNLNKEEFSKLCELILKNDNFLATLLLIIESNDASLIFKARGYSVALETLADIIIGNKKNKISPITSKIESKKFREELIQVLERYNANPYFQDIETLRGRITNINQMTNKERLLKPFKLLNVELTEDDKRVIASRNDFLHGRVADYRELGSNRSIEFKDNDLYYASVRLYTLLNIIILKYIGYDNYVINFTKIYEKNTTFEVNESYYRKV